MPQSDYSDWIWATPDGNIEVTPTRVVQRPGDSLVVTPGDVGEGGFTSLIHRAALAIGVNATVVNGASSRLFGGRVENLAATLLFLHFYNKATAPADTDTEVLTIALRANASQDIADAIGAWGLDFNVGLSYRVTTTVDGSGAVGVGAANDVLINLIYT